MDANTFQYDAFGRRTSKIIAGTQTGYLYDGANFVQELTASTPQANLLTGLGMDEFFGRTTSAGVRYPLTDALGSIIALTDASGNLLTSYTYSPYGETSATGATDSNSQEYTGRENDGTGLYYYRARYYSPTTGRFISEDPIGLAGGLNQYVYVNDNPLRWVDPTGLARFKACEDFGARAGSIAEMACNACTDAICMLPGLDKGCCKLDFDRCIADSGGDANKMLNCPAILEGCNLKKPKPLPGLPQDGEI